jgi:AcrR family transcriptional regulator
MSSTESLSIDTEAQIKAAAKSVFLKKGLAGTRMQEIADIAGIGRTALHYYFRSKEKLFEVVWRDAYQDMVDRTKLLGDGHYSTLEQMENFVEGYFDKALADPELDIFMLNEFNNHPDIMREILFSGNNCSPLDLLLQSIERSVKNGEMKGEPRQILISLISMCFFSFAGRGMIQNILSLDNDQFMKLMEERKAYLKSFLKVAYFS